MCISPRTGSVGAGHGVGRQRFVIGLLKLARNWTVFAGLSTLTPMVRYWSQGGDLFDYLLIMGC